MIRDDLTNEQYHAHDAISSSDVKAVLMSSVWHWRHQERKETPAMQLGTAVHDLSLEGGANTVCGPETRRGNAWKEAQEEAGDKLLLPEPEYRKAKAIADALRQDPVCTKQLDHPNALKEQSIFVQCPETGLQLKARPDCYNTADHVMADVKTTVDPSPDGFTRECYKYRYDVQGCFYSYVAELAGWDVKHFIFLSVSTTAPYKAHMHSMSLEALALGRKDMMYALKKIAEAKQSNVYETGWPRFTMIHPPQWMTTE